MARVFGPADALRPAKAKAQVSKRKPTPKKAAKKTKRASKGKPTLREQLEAGATEIRAAGMQLGDEGLHALASADSLSEYQREQFHLILEEEGAI